MTESCLARVQKVFLARGPRVSQKLVVSVATPAEPRAENILLFLQILGSEKLLEKSR